MTNGNDYDEDESERTIARRPAARAQGASVGHFLTFAEGDRRRRVAVGALGVTIGRVAPADLEIQSPDISRKHCRIEIEDGWAWVMDLNSTNGTFVDSRPVDEPTRLENGTTLSLGAFEVKYERRDPREVAREEDLTADLQRAADYVRAILPQPITSGPVQAEGWFVPSSQLGGDAYGYQFLDKDTLSGFVLDVSGHGIGSAMHAANVASVLRNRALPGVDFYDPPQVPAALNTMFPMGDHNELMLTVWYFIYDLPRRVVRFSSGGHHASYLVSPGVEEPTELTTRGSAIGMLPTGRWSVGMAKVPPGSRLYIFSDGAFEFVAASGQSRGIDGLRALIARPPEPGLPEARRIWREVREAARPGPLDDDFSMLVLTFP